MIFGTINLNADTIRSLSPTKKQVNGNKRKLNGYHAYIGMFFTEFATLDEEEKKEMLCAAGIHDSNDYITSEEDSVVSCPSIHTTDII